MTVGAPANIHVGDLRPNPWNPNVMTPSMMAKEKASIAKFGFLDPITCRRMPGLSSYQIIDGEHRWKAARELGYSELPCWVIDVPDEVAKQLTIVMNETRGSPDREKLEALVQDLSAELDRQELGDVLPFTPEMLSNMLGDDHSDSFEEVERKATAGTGKKLIERVFRLSKEDSDALDDAIDKARVEGAEDEAEALGTIAREYTS